MKKLSGPFVKVRFLGAPFLFPGASLGITLCGGEWLAYFGEGLMKILLVALLLGFTTMARADDYTDEQIVNAIYIIEGGAKATFAYGIRSVKYSTVAEARKICFNSVRNGRKRWIKAGKPYDLITFIGMRYCPTRGKLSRAEQKLNGNWLTNLRKQLAKNK